MALWDNPGVLHLLCSHLQSVADLHRFSAVSKAWFVASKEARPMTLEIGGRQRPFRKATAVSNTLQWLERKHEEGYFDSLRDITAELDWDPDDDEEDKDNPEFLQPFCQNVIMIMGFWQLQSCYLVGIFHLETAASLLPTSILRLTLKAHMCIMSLVSLSLFSRFAALQLLELALICDDMLDAVDFTALHEDVLRAGRFILEKPMPQLTSLKLSPWSLAISQQNDFKGLAALLPQLCHLAMIVPLMQAQSILNITNLEAVNLHLIDTHPHPGSLKRLAVASCSKLRSLNINNEMTVSQLVLLLNKSVDVLILKGMPNVVMIDSNSVIGCFKSWDCA